MCWGALCGVRRLLKRKHGSTSAALVAAGLSEGSAAVVTAAGAGVSLIDLSTAAGSQAALTTLDAAIITITDSRASMGAYQNRLAASISNLETTSMNLQASRSRILDTDYAKETTLLAKSQTTRLSGHRHTGPGQPVRPVGAGAAQISATA